jgi:uncharacterized protein YeaO (DUF488 family)
MHISKHSLSPLLLLICCLFSQTTTRAAASEWLYSTELKFISNHDVARIKLEGLDPIDLDNVIYHADPSSSHPLFSDSRSLTYDDVNQWQSGRIINIAYSSTCGTVLLDPASGKYIEIINGLEAHPIEMIYQQMMGNESTLKQVLAANEAIKLWKLEIARTYERLRLEFPHNATAFDTAEQQWHQHCEADLAAMSSATSNEGTIHSIISATDRISLHRNHALRIAQWGRF